MRLFCWRLCVSDQGRDLKSMGDRGLNVGDPVHSLLKCLPALKYKCLPEFISELTSPHTQGPPTMRC